MARGALWSPYYKITVGKTGEDTVVEVNNIFHQSMAPVVHKEYFYQWPYTVFGDSFKNVLILGAGSGTDVAAALMHGAEHVDAVEIDPTILRLGRQLHPDHPFDDPRVTVINDDARHYLRTTTKKYDLVVFALIDSLTLQSSFSGVRLESYMFTTESFRAVRDRLTDDGLLVVYNYFREKWLVDRLANIAAARSAASRACTCTRRAPTSASCSSGRGSRAEDRSGHPGARHRLQPGHGAGHGADACARRVDRTGHRRLAVPLPARSARAAALPLRAGPDPDRLGGGRGGCAGRAGDGRGSSSSWAPGFMLLETKAIIQFALLWGSTWVVASLAIASVLGMALVATFIVSRVEIRGRAWLRPRWSGCCC